eukprot:gnl/TRDRNA2_/TRDRNA2_175664_c2_seq3.p1 gnl/TRDRNA2_/TRDRNA2_175664_c2~~gnl/TRDRNA2_/TRDRNA2_175664_c2_seq3.p1  ORF type:complete len:777 (-),score=150.96 gnl/TRDRNA2_/TRDRNA2_175664_c2_seq3:244-2271(-)
MTWGGLRGAVGLALAIRLKRDKAGGAIGDDEAYRVFFYTAGIAFLTLIINATTCPMLVNWLGIAASNKAKTRVLHEIVKRMAEMVDDETGTVRKNVDHMLEEVMDHLDEELMKGEETSQFARQLSPGLHPTKIKQPYAIIKDYEDAKEEFNFAVSDLNKRLLGWQERHPLLVQEKRLIQLTRMGDVNPDMVRTINESFLALVRAELWEQIQRGEFVEGTRSSEMLLNSNTKAFQQASRGLLDFQSMCAMLGITEQAVDENGDPKTAQEQQLEEPDSSDSARKVYVRKSTKDLVAKSGDAPRRWDSGNLANFGVAVDHSLGGKKRSFTSRAKRLVKSVSFQGTIVFVICCNAVVIFFDPGAGSENSGLFVAIDCLFMQFYLTELFLKLAVLGKAYFMDAWNALDFMCVVLGLFGIITTLLVEAGILSSGNISSEMLLIRLGRVFKLLRLMRIVALVKFLRKMHAQYNNKKVSTDLAISLELIFTLRGFVNAHLQAQKQFLQYFGPQIQRCECGNKLMRDAIFCRKCGKKLPDDMPPSCAIQGGEQARCMMESWTAVYSAIYLASGEMDKVDEEGEWILEGLCALRDSAVVVKKLTNFALDAANSGVILAKDAETIIHPLHHHLRMTDRLMADAHSGIQDEKVRNQSDGGRSSVRLERFKNSGDAKWRPCQGRRESE